MKIVLFAILGLGIITVDLMFIPGGLLILVGSGLIIYSIYLNYIAYGLLPALLEMLVVMAILPFIIRHGLARLALKGEMHAEDGYVGVEDYSVHIGKEGEALTDLRPSGTVIVQDEGGPLRLDCIAEGGYIEAGEAVRVTSSNGPSLVVRRMAKPQ